MKNVKIVLLCIINILKSFLLIFEAFLMKNLIDKAVAKEDIFIDIILFISVIIILLLLLITGMFIRNSLNLDVEVMYKKRIYQALLKKDINEIERYHSGELSNIYLNDLNNINSGIVDIIPAIFLYASRFIFAFIALLYFSYILLFILIGLAIIAFIGARIYGSLIKKKHKEALQSDGKVNAFMQESFENIKLVKAMEIENNLNHHLDELIEENYKIKKSRNYLTIFGNSGISIFINITTAIAIVFGAVMLKGDVLSYGSILALIQIVSYFEGPIQGFSVIISKYNAFLASKDRIDNLLNLKEQVISNYINDFDYIKIDNITFGYDNLIFKDFSYTFEKGKTYLIKGSSGRGKTTLFNLLLGFIRPASGKIEIKYKDNLYDIDKCRGLFSYVNQNNILFSGTIRENVSLFIEHFDEDKLNEALKLCCVYDEIMTKEKGLDTPLIERGGGLSIGQIQRILLAIAIMMNRPILLLDEFTSSLDKKLEQQIVKNVSNLNSSKIIITHRDIEIENAITLDLGENYE